MTIKIINSETDEPVPFASVSANDESGEFIGVGTTANDSGIAEIDYNDWTGKGATSVTISSAEFIPESRQLDLSLDGSVVSLEPSNNELPEIIVTAKRKPKIFVIGVVLLAVGAIAMLLNKK